MKIVYCRRCANELADTAPTCPKRGAAQARVLGAAAPLPVPPAGDTGAIGRWILMLVLVGLLASAMVMLAPALA